MSNEAKKGIAINQFDGIKQWYVVEYNDNTAAIYADWDTAFRAGGFQPDRPELRLVS